MVERPKPASIVGGAPISRPGLDIVELATPAMLNLRGAADDAGFRDAVQATFGMTVPTDANRFVEAGGAEIAWLGPDEWLLIGPAQAEDGLAQHLDEALAGILHAVTDVTGNRTLFRISGFAARDLLGIGCSLDLHPRVFGPGQCAQTLIARTGALILQRDALPTYDLFVRRSYAAYFREWLGAAAAMLD